MCGGNSMDKSRDLEGMKRISTEALVLQYVRARSGDKLAKKLKKIILKRGLENADLTSPVKLEQIFMEFYPSSLPDKKAKVKKRKSKQSNSSDEQSTSSALESKPQNTKSNEDPNTEEEVSINVNYNEASKSFRRPVEQDRSWVICNKCSEKGHIGRACPKAKCFNCQGFGHLSMDCKNPAAIRPNPTYRRIRRNSWRKYGTGANTEPLGSGKSTNEETSLLNPGYLNRSK